MRAIGITIENGPVSQALDRVIRALSDPKVYPHCPESVEVVQTHISVVFIAGDLVYKVKKPLNLGFLDYTTPEKRRHFCRREVVLNSRYSEDIYLDVVPICEGASGINLSGDGTEIESAVLMRRIPAERTFLSMLLRNAVTGEVVDRVADRLTELHAEADRGPQIDGFGSVEVILRNIKENFDQTRPFIGRTIDREVHEAVSSRAFEFVGRHRGHFAQRVRDGHIRDCHGDLHLDHVILVDGIMLCDCIEFNDRFRYGDTAADLGFLLMDLDFLGFPAFSGRLARRYAEVAADAGILDLLGFYQSYRAFVRGKVLSFTLDEPEIPDTEKDRAARTARDYFRLALGYFWRTAKPFLVITAGLTGSGKSYLAERLGLRVGVTPLRSDVVRKELEGQSPQEHRLDKYGEGIYTPKATEGTYRELLRRARWSLLRGESVIVDATFMSHEDRSSARATADEAAARFALVSCGAPDHVIRERLDTRMRTRVDPSDGRWEIFLDQKAHFDPIRDDERQFQRHWDADVDINTFLAALVRDLTIP